MAESRQHKDMVHRIVSYIETMPDCCRDFIEADLSEYNTRVTRVVGGFYPDVYYKDENQIIIGEAKTESDIITSHTYNQINSYISECSLFNGEKNIVLCVPFIASNTLYNYIGRLIEDYIMPRGIKFHLINDTETVDLLCL